MTDQSHSNNEYAQNKYIKLSIILTTFIKIIYSLFYFMTSRKISLKLQKYYFSRFMMLRVLWCNKKIIFKILHFVFMLRQLTFVSQCPFLALHYSSESLYL